MSDRNPNQGLNLLVVFGAGASAARSQDWETGPVDLAFQPPLASELFGRPSFASLVEEKYPRATGLVARIRGDVARGVGVEEALDFYTGLVIDQLDLLPQLMAVRFYLQELIGRCGSQWPRAYNGFTPYVRLLQELEFWRSSTGGRVTFVTFNYDTILEEAIETITGFRIGSLEDYVSGDYAIVKVHGSVTWGHLTDVQVPDTIWTEQENGSRSGISRDQNRDAPRIVTESARSVEMDPEIVWLGSRWPVPRIDYASTRALVPALAVPLANKASLEECPSSHLEVLRHRLKEANRLLVVGWAGNDSHFLTFCKDHLETPDQILALVANGGVDSGQETTRRLGEIGLRSDQLRVADGGFSDLLGDLRQIEWLLGYEFPRPFPPYEDASIWRSLGGRATPEERT